MRRFILDLDDTLANTTRDLQGDPKRIPQLTLVPGASEFLKTHRGQCILLTAGVAEDQRKKIEALAIRKYFRSIHIVQRPEHKPQKLEEIVRSVEKGCSASARYLSLS